MFKKIILLCFLLISVNVYAEDANTLLLNELGNRHFQSNSEALASSFPNKDAYAEALISASQLNSPQYLPIRAVKLLMKISEIDQVREVLKSYVADPQKMGLASTILANLDLVSDATFKKELAMTALNSADSTKSERKLDIVSLERYKSILSENDDPEIRDLSK